MGWVGWVYKNLRRKDDGREMGEVNTHPWIESLRL
jgi:hypothetical protein